ncbi:hypothetical protein OG625_00280 [Streptomyces sp. NBC_01351]|uniref:hypothetical protein n=1 Tax=Streptomyces sp. NBC_01351 TaxID=2903833 RepID=UPI002E314EDE|nr:hypothetical protein [Streptomyces sp. NBC_01351]
MDQIFDFITDNSGALTILVPFLAILGGIWGNRIGAKIQASGGKAQASAARDAARITAEAQRLAALHTDRRIEIAAFIRAARDSVKSASLMFLRPGYDGPAKQAYTDLQVQLAEVEVIAPEQVVELARQVVTAVEDYLQLASSRADAARVTLLLTSQRVGRPGYQIARRALSTLEALRTAYEAEDNEGEQQAFRSAASTALDDIPDISSNEAELLLADAALPTLEPLKHQRHTAFSAALTNLITATRAVLRSNDFEQHQPTT